MLVNKINIQNNLVTPEIKHTVKDLITEIKRFRKTF